MQIPDEAVEAAAKQIWRDSALARRTCEAWGGLDASEQWQSRESARRALEAAAPYMLGPVWEQGFDAGPLDANPYTELPNPYRSQA